MYLAVCVVQSAMHLVETPQQINDPVLTPWIRVSRFEAKSRSSLSSESSHRHYATDFVHIDYFDTFLKANLLPFALEFFQRASTVADVLQGWGVVDNIDTWRWGERINAISQ
jgi:hypothetical protein